MTTSSKICDQSRSPINILKIASRCFKSLCWLMLILSVANLYAQTQKDFCGTTEHMNRLKLQRPNLEEELQQAEPLIQQWINNSPYFRTTGFTKKIPVVVHVVWKMASQNISDLQVRNTILALNQDYGRTGADTVNTPAVWKPIAANTGIQFCLAKRDPFGAPTNGIERRQTTVTSFTTNDLVKSYKIFYQ